MQAQRMPLFRTRFWEIDALRGAAIVMMVLFHLIWDLNYLSLFPINPYTGFWGLFQKATASLFLFLVGVVLPLSYERTRQQGHQWLPKMAKRAATLYVWAFSITLFTFFFFPQQFIYFGILHLIATSILFSFPFIGHPQRAAAAGLIIALLPMMYPLNGWNIPLLIWLGAGVPAPTLDFFPVIPWFSVVLFGIAAGHTLYPQGIPRFRFPKPSVPGMGALQWMGRHSLLIYFLHQPVLLGVLTVLM